MDSLCSGSSNFQSLINWFPVVSFCAEYIFFVTRQSKIGACTSATCLASVGSFPALYTGYMFFRALHCLHVSLCSLLTLRLASVKRFSRFVLVTCFSAIFASCTVYHPCRFWLHLSRRHTRRFYTSIAANLIATGNLEQISLFINSDTLCDTLRQSRPFCSPIVYPLSIVCILKSRDKIAQPGLVDFTDHSRWNSVLRFYDATFLYIGFFCPHVTARM